ncbi:hypothetical protein KR026_003209, partial [Drosophila bipectinata]
AQCTSIQLQQNENTSIAQPTINLKNLNSSDYEFLVTGGYRPEHNNLIKYVVSVRAFKQKHHFGDNHACGGTIITKSAVLTAAHCLYNAHKKLKAKHLSVVAGTPKRLVRVETTQSINVKRFKVHPKYKQQRSHKNDLAVLILEKDLSIGESAATITVPQSKPQAGQNCTVVGWGTVLQFGPLPDEALNANMQILPLSYCKTLEGFKEEGMICASNPKNFEVDSCQGDSGGPLICGERIYGIVSFGRGCGEPNNAGVYTDVYYFRDWIAKNSCAQDVMQLPLVVLLLIIPLKLVN